MGKEYEDLKTVIKTVIKKNSENNEDHKPHTDTIIRSLKI